MKRILFAIALLCAYVSAHAQHTFQVDNGPGKVGIFDVSSITTNRTFTLPNTSGTVLVVNGSNLTINGNSLNWPATAVGYLYNDGAGNLSWAPVGSGTQWLLAGNSGTTAGTNFVGTTDNIALHLSVRNGATINNSLIFGTNASISREISGTTAGNARGANAVDMQTLRGAATQVASGASSTIGGGVNNTASGNYSTVGGGNGNSVSALNSTVGGGTFNVVTDQSSVIAGGSQNAASGSHSTIGGGYTNQASGVFSTVSGGTGNVSSNYGSVVGGGGYNGIGFGANTASGNSSTVSGGWTNTASGGYATVAGGTTNTASGNYSVVAGGINNSATATGTFVGGGANNTASTSSAVVVGGGNNTAQGTGAAIGGGTYNTTTGNWNTIPGGNGLTLSGDRSFGFLANATPAVGQMIVNTANTAVFGNVDLWLANNDNTSRSLRFYEAYNTVGAFPNTAKYVAFKSPSALTATQTYTLPLDYPSVSGYVLSSTTGGALSWVAGGGTVTSFSFTNGGGFTGNVTNATTTPTLSLTLDNGSVTLAKIANAVGNSKLVGSGATGSGSSYTEISVGSGLTMTGTTLTTSAAGGTIMGGNTGANSNGGRFASPFGTNETGTEADVQIVCPRSGTLKNLYCVLSAAPGGATSKTITVRVGGANTALAVTISGAATTGNNTGSSVSVNAGDLLSVAVTHTGGPANSKVNWGFEIQ